MACVGCHSNITSASYSYLYASQTIGFITLFPHLKINFCEHCELGQVEHSSIAEEQLNEYYAYTYRDKAKLGADDGSEYRKKFLIAKAEGQAKLINKYVVSKKIKKIFEFGAGYGYNLAAVGKTFPSAELYTNELDQTIDKLPGVRKYQSTLKYDLIVMSHVLEHLIFPEKVLQKMIVNLQKDGILFIEVPNEQATVKNASSFVEPHITFFNLNSLKSLIEKNFNEELEILYIGTAGLCRVGDSKDTLVEGLNASLFSRMKRYYRWLMNGMNHPIHIDFSNDTTKDKWNNVRLICKKKG
ncbi:MAG: class I SAM-dependent methyltransferase [Legionella sp.]|nr:class I SAM-dependent methyltransferase [Legionella sp.]